MYSYVLLILYSILCSEFARYRVFLLAASLIPHGELFAIPDYPIPQCMLVVDAGFSFTHVIPILNGAIVWNAVKRCVINLFVFSFFSGLFADLFYVIYTELMSGVNC